jgi:hypothetical protein
MQPREELSQRMSYSVDKGQTGLQVASLGRVVIVAAQALDSRLRKSMDRIDVNQARVLGLVTATGEA